MACSCCSQGCKCIIPGKSDGDTTPSPNLVVPFSYKGFRTPGPWINRKYPIPLFQAAYDNKSGLRYAPNAVFLDNGLLNWAGDLQYLIGYSRSGIPAPYDPFSSPFYNTVGTWEIPDWDGDNSRQFEPGNPLGGSTPTVSSTRIALEEKEDQDKRECQLWIRYSKKLPVYDENGNFTYNYTFTDWGEPELLHSIPWNEPAGPQIVITIPGSKFVDIENVEIRFYCKDICSLIVDYNTGEEKELGWIWTIEGQPSYISKSTIEMDKQSVPLDHCTSYGSFNGTYTANVVNCEEFPWIRSYFTIFKSEKIFMRGVGCFGSNNIGISFTGTSGDCCERSLGPCAPIPGYYDPYRCCGNLYGAYQTLADGTINCSCGGHNAWGDFGSDPYAVEIINTKKIVVKGGWRYNVETWSSLYNCKEVILNPWIRRGTSEESMSFTAGTVTINGV